MSVSAAAPPVSRHAPATVRVWAIVVGLAAIGVLTPYVRLLMRDGNLTRPIRFGENFAARVVPAIRAQPHVVVPGDGFDGQFYAQLAIDPMLHDPQTAAAIDDPSIRDRRIVLPAVAWLLGAGRPALILWIFPLLNLAAWIGLAVLAWRALRDHGLAGPFAFLAIVFAPGAIESASRCVPDLPAVALAWTAFSVATTGVAASIVFAVAALTRETMLLAWVTSIRRQPAKRLLGLTTLVIAPLAIWSISLVLRLGSPERPDGQNLGWPLQGVGRTLSVSVSILTGYAADGAPLNRAIAVQRLLLLVSLVVQLAFLLRWPRTQETLWRWGVVCGLFVLCLSWASWEAFFSVTRHLLPLHIAFNVLLASIPTLDKRRWLWFALGNAYILPRLLFWLGYP